MEPRDRLLAKIPPLLDGYEAICQAIALGDVDHAWHLSRELYKSAQPVKRQAVAVGIQLDRRDKRGKL